MLQYSLGVIKVAEQNAIGRLLCWVALGATLIVTPWASYDPINLPKLAVISTGGFMCLAFVVTQLKKLKGREFRAPLLIAAAFIADLILVLILSGTNFNQEFFGTNGRATGFVAYVALTGLLVAGMIAATGSVLERFSWTLVLAGFLSIIYGLIQTAGLDPIAWVNQYSPVLGFLGNPDFQSSFVAFALVMVFSLLLKKSTTVVTKIAGAIYLLAGMFVIFKTGAQQGFLVLVAGVAIVFLTYVKFSKAKKAMPPLLLITAVSVFAIVIGIFNKGPLSLLHKASVIYRGDYWRAGWKMTIQHPFFGIGLDSYGDWYRRARTVAATLRRGPDITSNAAHNVLIDFSSNGGFPLVIIYLALLGITIKAALAVIRRSTTFDPIFTGLFAVWVAYQLQSVISLNQLGLAVWGWIISGLVIGWEINTRSSIEVAPNQKKSNQLKSKNIELKPLPSTTITLFVGLLIGLLVGIGPLIASSRFKSILQTQNPTLIANAVYIFPQEAARSIQIAYLFQQNKMDSKALSIIEKVVRKYPDEYPAWKVMSMLTTASAQQLAEAKAQMKRLDPHNPELK